MYLGVIFGPDGNERRALCPLARILTEFPPTSTTSTLFATDFSPAVARCRRTAPRSALNSDVASTAASSPLEDGAFGPYHRHQIIPRVDERPHALLLNLPRHPTHFQ